MELNGDLEATAGLPVRLELSGFILYALEFAMEHVRISTKTKIRIRTRNEFGTRKLNSALPTGSQSLCTLRRFGSNTMI
jgi:hypothetical protein